MCASERNDEIDCHHLVRCHTVGLRPQCSVKKAGVASWRDIPENFLSSGRLEKYQLRVRSSLPPQGRRRFRSCIAFGTESVFPPGQHLVLRHHLIVILSLRWKGGREDWGLLNRWQEQDLFGTEKSGMMGLLHQHHPGKETNKKITYIYKRLLLKWWNTRQLRQSLSVQSYLLFKEILRKLFYCMCHVLLSWL